MTTGGTDHTPWLAALDAARHAQQEVEQMRKDVRSKLRWAVLTAHEEGRLGVTQIASHLGVHRQYVYQVLEAARGEFPAPPRT